ncbi:hypothetical protein BKA66DRAFT_469114 [Pyrenochaeta sp. MPI-SDFR-AT-0127]|nr:hypothetical protein BKA66DRAFT_469114 [Pyrenochaeta sp. MPI-SDFR-AT-0127]
MPYHPDFTDQNLFIEQHLNTAATLTEVICSICRQRCSRRHEVVQISGHPQCQCVFGRVCILQWLSSNGASSNTCPSCNAVLYNPQHDDNNGEPSITSSSSSDRNLHHQQHFTRQTIHIPRPFREYDLRSRPHTSASASSPSPSTDSRILSANSATSDSSTTSNAAIENFVDNLWAGTWDLVVESWELTPPDQRTRRIKHAQLLALVLDICPLNFVDRPLREHLALRARRMVHKHRKNGVFDTETELRTEREDVRMAVEYGI